MKKVNFSKIYKKLTKEVTDDNKASLFAGKVNKRMFKKSTAYGIAGGVAAASSIWSYSSASSRNNLGTIIPQSGTLSNMVSGTLSPGISSVQKGKKNYSDSPINKIGRKNMVEGDIVFALHNMR